ncbi:MAG: VOC family protein [Bacteroidota bacterium]
MKRVTGIGGIFFKCKNKKELLEWYKKHLGIPAEEWGAMFFSKNETNPNAYLVWSPFPSDTKYFSPSEKEFMINFRVDDLHALLKVLREEGVTVMEKVEESEYGKFGWIIDPEGNKIELWEMPGENQ